MTEQRPLVGIATIVTRAFAGQDLTALSDQLLDRVEKDPGDADALFDLSIVLQVLFKPRAAMEFQQRALELRRTFSIAPATGRAELRLLVLMAPGDLMANAPVDFLLDGSNIAMEMLFLDGELSPDSALGRPGAVPEHDVVYVAIAHSDANAALLAALDPVLERWDRPVLNMPKGILRTTREAAAELLGGAPGIVVPTPVRVPRRKLEMVAGSDDDNAAVDTPVDRLATLGGWPVLVRPVDSHAGHGLSRIESRAQLSSYLSKIAAAEFYVSPFIDYRGRDGRYRKFRVVLVDGKPYASHMAISDDWMIHYLNAGMSESAEKRAEEAQFMETFESAFAARHRRALTEIASRFELDYLVIDCAETPDGKLLVFEVDAAAVVHAMDPVDLFPYKHVHMRKVFSAFQAMVAARARTRV